MRRYGRVAALILVAAAVLTLGSCTWFVDLFNFMNIDDERYDLTQMVVTTNIMTIDSNNVHAILLMSDGLDYNISTDEITGSGDYMMVGIVSSGSTISDDDYNFSTSGAAGTFIGGQAVLGFSSSSMTYDTIVVVDGGDLSIRDALTRATVLQFDFNAYDADTSDNMDISGRFRGRPDEYDYSEYFPSVQSIGDYAESLRSAR